MARCQKEAALRQLALHPAVSAGIGGSETRGRLRRRFLRAGHEVADAGLGEDVAGVGGGVAELLAQPLDDGQVVSAFQDPDGEPQVLVVVDKLITGFDAPVEQVLYLDRSMRDHTLLQAIARVNRRFSHTREGVTTEKSHGLVVDYHGISRSRAHASEARGTPRRRGFPPPAAPPPCSRSTVAPGAATAHLGIRSIFGTRRGWAIPSGEIHLYLLFHIPWSI